MDISLLDCSSGRSGRGDSQFQTRKNHLEWKDWTQKPMLLVYLFTHQRRRRVTHNNLLDFIRPRLLEGYSRSGFSCARSLSNWIWVFFSPRKMDFKVIQGLSNVESPAYAKNDFHANMPPSEAHNRPNGVFFLLKNSMRSNARSQSMHLWHGTHLTFAAHRSNWMG